jgi:hypothetical protein
MGAWVVWLVWANAALAIVRVSAVAVAAAIANFFIRVTPVLLESLLRVVLSAGLPERVRTLCQLATKKQIPINQQLNKNDNFRNHAKCMSATLSTCKLRVLTQA